MNDENYPSEGMNTEYAAAVVVVGSLVALILIRKGFIRSPLAV